jgi:RNA polymerase sigma-70 factor (ECF subfamily)
VALITEHQPAIYAYILTMCPNRTTAKDILQETNLVLWRKASDFDLNTSFKAWAFRIAYFQTLAHLKQEKRKGWMVLDDELVEAVAAEAPARLDDLEERQDALKGCLEKLPPNDLKILTAYYEERLKLEEIAERLGRSQGALKQVLFRVRRALRRCIELSQGSPGGLDAPTGAVP